MERKRENTVSESGYGGEDLGTIVPPIKHDQDEINAKPG